MKACTFITVLGILCIIWGVINGYYLGLKKGYQIGFSSAQLDHAEEEEDLYIWASCLPIVKGCARTNSCNISEIRMQGCIDAKTRR